VIWTVVYALGAVQAAFLALVLASNGRDDRRSNQYLIGLLAIIFLILSLFSLRTVWSNGIPPWLFWFVVSTPMLIGPTIYLHVQQMITSESSPTKRQYLHILPFILLIMLHFDELTTPVREGLHHLDYPQTIQKVTIAAYIKTLSILLYLVAALLSLNKATDERRLASLYYKVLKLGIAIFIGISVLGSVQSTLFWMGAVSWIFADQFELTFLSLFTFLLVFLELKRNKSFDKKDPKYQKTQLTDQLRRSLKDQLIKLLEIDLTFTEPDYGPALLADKLGISEHQLSEVISLEFDSNFHQLSNQFRFALFTRLINEQPDKNLLELAFDAGFRSKSSFNRAIKNLTNLSPSAYRDSLLNRSV
jgi:AraC-like DNA-binding protein